MRAPTFSKRTLTSVFDRTMSAITTTTDSNAGEAFFRQPFYAKDGKTRLPQYVAHRGFNKIYPENTLSAFQAAIDVGCHGIETDVQISRDGVVVISHVLPPIYRLEICERLIRVTGFHAHPMLWH